MSLESYRFSRKDFFSSRICHAPARNLFITSTGDVIPCCFNRNTIYGNIIIENLDAIETSPARTHLDRQLKKNDLSGNCKYCANVITRKNYKAAGSLSYDLPVFQKGHFPCFMEFELDTFCNLNCLMCPPGLHSSKTQNLFGPTFVEKIAPLLKNLKWAKFYGGEPFLITIYYEIWEKIISINPNCIIKVQTNGTVLNDKVKQLLERAKFQISISVDSLKPETYNMIRKGADFNHMFSNLQYFLDYSGRKKIAADIAVCPMNLNAEDIPELVDFCRRNSTYINFNLVEYPKKNSLKYSTSKQLNDIIAAYRLVNFSSRDLISWQIKKHLRSLVNHLEKWKDDAIEREKSPVVEIEKSDLIEIISKNLPCETKALAVQKFILAMSGFDNKISLRQDTLERISSLKANEILYFLENKSENKIAESIGDILRFGF